MAGYGKYQHRFSDHSSLTLVRRRGRHLEQHSEHHQPDARAGRAVRRQLPDGRHAAIWPTARPIPTYYGYDFYHVQTDFEYAAYTYRPGRRLEVRHQGLHHPLLEQAVLQNGATVNLTTAKPSGVDKLNGYRHAGDTVILSKESKWGIFRTGVWYDWAYTDRYQFPSNILTGLDTPLPQLPRAFHHAVLPAVCRIRMAPDSRNW